MLVLVTCWYAAIDSDRAYHMRVTENNTILPALKNPASRLEPASQEPGFREPDFREPGFREPEPEPVPRMVLASRKFITACKALNYRVILTQLVTF